MKGQIGLVRKIMKGSVLFSVGEGALSAAISASVFLLTTFGTREEGAWYGTFARLFQSILTPLLLVMVPISSFITTRWRGLDKKRQRLLLSASTAAGVLYGAFGAACLTFGGRPFLERFYHLPPVGTGAEVAAISLLFLGILSEKAYGMVVYALDNGRTLSLGAFAAVAVSALFAVVGIHFFNAMQTLAIAAFIGGVLLVLVIGFDFLQRYRQLGEDVMPHSVREPTKS